LDFDVEALFPFLSNNDPGAFNFDSFPGDLFSIPVSPSQPETTIPRFTELNGDEPVETINADDDETNCTPTPAVVSRVESGKKTRYCKRLRTLMVIGLVARQQGLSRAAIYTDVLARKDAFNVGNGDKKYNTACPLSNEIVHLRHTGRSLQVVPGTRFSMRAERKSARAKDASAVNR